MTPPPTSAFPASLLTASPEEGFQLALKIARLNVAAIQTDVEIRKRLRPVYAESSEQLIASAQVTATYFDTIAQANHYWR